LHDVAGFLANGLPMGLSILGAPGTDGTLVAVADMFTRK
jgi:Asp-tRNA(Asn)/Glu-tRNA(Gln) amidotransferase A subunit family amidase